MFPPVPKIVYDPHSVLPGGFGPRDGTVDFYQRIRNLLTPDSVCLDLGAGRASWFEDDKVKFRRELRDLRGAAREVIAADLDEAVLSNRASDKRLLFENSVREVVGESSIDVVVADFVLEHIESADDFASSIHFVLKDGGWFCARTPHKYSYVALLARLVSNKHHARLLKNIQPGRKEVDIFPTRYKMNTLSALSKSFPGWKNQSFIYPSDVSYFFGRKSVYQVLSILHNSLWSSFSGTMFVFMQKPHASQ